MKIINKQKYVLSLIALLAMLLSSCGTTAPLKSRDSALAAIKHSETVNAELYTQELYTNSKGKYDEGQTLIVEDKKSSKNSKAKALYVAAKKLAEKAYKEAIGPFTKAFIDATAVALEEAKADKVHRASEALYEQASKENSDASDLLTKEDFSEAQEISLSSRMTLEEAITEAKRLAALIAEQEGLIQKLKEQSLAMKAANATPDEWESVVEFHESILGDFEEGYYSQVFEDNKELVVNLKDLIALIEEKKQEAIRELAEASKTIDQLKGHRVTIDQEISKLNEEYQNK